MGVGRPGVVVMHWVIGRMGVRRGLARPDGAHRPCHHRGTHDSHRRADRGTVDNMPTSLIESICQSPLER